MRLFLATPFWVLTYVFVITSHLSHFCYNCAAFTTVAVANGWREAVKQLMERGN